MCFFGRNLHIRQMLGNLQDSKLLAKLIRSIDNKPKMNSNINLFSFLR